MGRILDLMVNVTAKGACGQSAPHLASVSPSRLCPSRSGVPSGLRAPSLSSTGCPLAHQGLSEDTVAPVADAGVSGCPQTQGGHTYQAHSDTLFSALYSFFYSMRRKIWHLQQM